MSIEFTLNGDAEQLEQYYSLRERCFRDDLGLARFDGSEEEEDRSGQILLALQDGTCVGGIRISPEAALPSQVDLLKLDRDKCCMWERFVIDPRVRTVQFFAGFCANLAATTRDIGYHHAMILSSLRNARFYRRCHSALGVEFRILRQVPHCAQGEFAGLEHFLSVAHLPEEQALQVAV